MKLELTGKVLSNRNGWQFETEINGRKHTFGKDNKRVTTTCIIAALDEIIHQFNEDLIEEGEVIKITIER